jgi:hypothetical protein
VTHPRPRISRSGGWSRRTLIASSMPTPRHSTGSLAKTSHPVAARGAGRGLLRPQLRASRRREAPRVPLHRLTVDLRLQRRRVTGRAEPLREPPLWGCANSERPTLCRLRSVSQSAISGGRQPVGFSLRALALRADVAVLGAVRRLARVVVANGVPGRHFSHDVALLPRLSVVGFLQRLRLPELRTAHRRYNHEPIETPMSSLRLGVGRPRTRTARWRRSAARPVQLLRSNHTFCLDRISRLAITFHRPADCFLHRPRGQALLLRLRTAGIQNSAPRVSPDCGRPAWLGSPARAQDIIDADGGLRRLRAHAH